MHCVYIIQLNYKTYDFHLCIVFFPELDPNFVLVFGPNDFSNLHGGGTYEYALLGGELPDFEEVKSFLSYKALNKGIIRIIICSNSM